MLTEVSNASLRPLPTAKTPKPVLMLAFQGPDRSGAALVKLKMHHKLESIAMGKSMLIFISARQRI